MVMRSMKNYLWNGVQFITAYKDNLISVLAVVEFYRFLLHSLARVKIVSEKKTVGSKCRINPVNTLHTSKKE